jgi:tetratricopeptide (TPR) repeat protein
VLASVFALAIVLRAVYAVQYAGSPAATALIGDGETFDAWAQQIARGNWLGNGAFYQAPLYPYLLGALYALAGHSLLAVQVLQAALGALSCVLVADAARRSFGREVGLLTGVLLAVYAPAIYYGVLLEKSALTLFELALLFHTLARCGERPTAGRFAAVGLILGAIALTRENATLLLFAVVPWIWWANRAVPPPRRASWSCAVAAGILVFLLPVAIRNRAVTGEFVITTTNFGSSLYIGNHAGADGLYSPLRVGRGHSRYESVDATEIAEANIGHGSGLSSSEISAYWRDAALTWMKAHPAAWLALMGRKFRWLCSDREWMDSQSYIVARDESPLLGFLGSFARWGSLFPCALLGLCVAWNRRRSLALWYASILLLAGGIALFWIFGRFRLGLCVCLAPFAAVGVAWVIASMRERAGRKLLGATAVLSLGAACAFWPVPGELEYPVAGTYANLGSALLRGERTLEARAAFERSRGDRPDYAAAYLGLGTICSLAGDIEGATSNLEHAAALEPALAAYCKLVLAELEQRRGHSDEARIQLRAAMAAGVSTAEDYYRIGLLERQLGEPTLARAAYERALAIRPGYVEAHNNLGYLLAHLGLEAEALGHYERALALDPNYTLTLLNLGWLRARAVDHSLRDPKAASELARRASALLGPDAPGVRELQAVAEAERKDQDP